MKGKVQDGEDDGPSKRQKTEDGEVKIIRPNSEWGEVGKKIMAKLREKNESLGTNAHEMIEAHRQMKMELMELDGMKRFSAALKLNDEEKAADQKLQAMISKITDHNGHNLTTKNFYEQKQFMESSDLFRALNAMPKCAIHRIHTTAAIPIDAYLKVTYNDIVYYN